MAQTLFDMHLTRQQGRPLVKRRGGNEHSYENDNANSSRVAHVQEHSMCLSGRISGGPPTVPCIVDTISVHNCGSLKILRPWFFKNQLRVSSLCRRG